MSSTDKINVLIVDDTILYRRILREVVEGYPHCVVAGTAPDGEAALQRIAQGGVDLVLLDVEMPVLNGLDTLRRIKREHTGVGVIMVSGVNKNAAAITITALQEGALEFVPKPEGADPAASREQLSGQLKRHIEAFQTQRLLQQARRGGAPPASREIPAATLAPSVAPAAHAGPGMRSSVPAAAAPPGARRMPKEITAVVIGISTGGPNALHEMMPKLPGDLGVPVLVVQHMPPVFTASLARSLDKISVLSVEEAVEGGAVAPNRVYIAPGGKHMVLRRNVAGDAFEIGLNENPPENNCRPAADVLFRSVAAHIGGNVLSVIMTGMGADGCKGVRSIRQQGGVCLAQDEASCVVYGMPRSVAEAGLVDEVVPLNQLHERIAAWVRSPQLAAAAKRA